MTAPYYTDESVTLWHGDCLDVLRGMPDASVESVVTDPPYSLTFMGRDWDRHDSPGAFQRWCRLWAVECLRVLKPGGHLLAFGGTRTSHRLACAVEDAGFEIRDSIAWLYGSGFPKSLNVGRAVDRRLCPAHSDDPDHECPAAPEAAPWRGHGTAMKPAHEPIVVARKPLTGTVAANVLTYGTGALNVDDCRIGTDDALRASTVRDDIRGGRFATGHHPDPGDLPTYSQNTAGRWPANVVLDESQAAALDEQSGEVRSAGIYVKGSRGLDPETGKRGSAPFWVDGLTSATYADTGGASRFFYTAKADTRERIRLDDTAHPTVKPLSLMRWLVRLVTPPGGTVLDPFAGSGTTAEACILEGFRCITIEKEPDYLPLIVQRVNRRRDPIAYTRTAGEDLGLFAFREGEGA